MQHLYRFLGGVAISFLVLTCSIDSQKLIPIPLPTILPPKTTTTPAPRSPLCVPGGSDALPACFDSTLMGNGGRCIDGNTPTPTVFPPWMNVTLAKLGQEFMQNNIFSVVVGFGMGIVLNNYPDGGLFLSWSRAGFNYTTNSLAGEATLVQIIVWALSDLNGPDIASSITKSKIVHEALQAGVAAQLKATGYIIPPDFNANKTLTTAMNGPFPADLNNSALAKPWPGLPPSQQNPTNCDIVPMNQQIFGLIEFGFFAYPLLFAEKLGITDNDENFLGYLHFCACLGYAFGVDDVYNIALQTDIPTALAEFQAIFDTYVVPTLVNLNFDGKCMMETFLISAGGVTNTILTPNFLLYMICKNILEIDCTATEATLNPQEIASYTLFNTYFSGGIPLSLLCTELAANLGLEMNAFQWVGLYTTGLDMFGPKFLNLSYCANEVFFAKEMGGVTPVEISPLYCPAYPTEWLVECQTAIG